MTRCGMCFKAKDLVPPLVGMAPVVCKGCFYEIDRVLGYLETIAVPVQPPLATDVIAPQTPHSNSSSSKEGDEKDLTPTGRRKTA